MTPEFFLTSIIVILLPGTGVLYTLAFGLGQGVRASVFAAFGCTLGIVPHITASVVGLAALLHASAVAFQVLKYLGAAYLLFMAWSVLRETGALSVSARSAGPGPGKIVTEGFLINILNPKLSIFFLAFLPQFVPASTGHPTAIMLGLGALFMLMTFVVFVGYGAFAAAARAHVTSRPRVMAWLRRLFAGAFVILSLKLALSER
jgi:threonine/homoserine/homoserine lactone efflux protein